MPKDNRMYSEMIKAAAARLQNRDPLLIAENAGVRYEAGAFYFTCFGKETSVSYPECTFSPELGMWESLSALHYLDLADGSELSGQQISFSQHRDGLIRGGGFDRDAEAAIRDKLGALMPEELTRRAKALGAEIVPSNADFCADFLFMPHYPIRLKIWFADEEFKASGRMQLDARAEHYLTIEDAVTVGGALLDALIQER